MHFDQRVETGKLLNSFKTKLTPKTVKDIVSNRDADGDTKLMLLVIQEHNDFADFIIQQCMDPVLLDTQNDNGQSILHVAVYLKENELVTKLISKGARIDLVDSTGRNIFHLCAEYGHLDVIQTIIQIAIRTTKFKSIGHLLDMVDYDGYTPFYLAAKNKNKIFCRYLSSLGVNVNSVNPKNGNTVLHDVVLSNVYSDQVNFIKFLIEECHVDVKIQNYFEMTAEITAQVNGKGDIASLLQNWV